MNQGARNTLIFAAALSTAGGIGLYSTTRAPVAPLTVILLSVDGSTRTCPAQGMEFGAGGVLTIAGLACASDSIFRSGFEQ